MSASLTAAASETPQDDLVRSTEYTLKESPNKSETPAPDNGDGINVVKTLAKVPIYARKPVFPMPAPLFFLPPYLGPLVCHCGECLTTFPLLPQPLPYVPDPLLPPFTVTYFPELPHTPARREFYQQCIARRTHSDPDPFPPQATLILPGLFLSDMYSATSPRVLQRLRPTHVLSVVPPPWPAYAPHVAVRRLALDDTPDTDLAPHLAGAVAWIADARAAGGTVLVHCIWGKSRSASVVLAYLVAAVGMPLAGALAYVRARREIVRPNAGFMRQLRAYEASLVGAQSEPAEQA